MNRRKHRAAGDRNRTQTATPPTAAAAMALSLQTAMTVAPATVDILHLVCFQLAGEEMAVPVDAVVEVVRGGGVNPIADSSRYLAGMMSYRSETIPVIHLKRWLDTSAVEEAAGSRVIVMTRGDKLFGLAVDEVTQVLRGYRRRLEEPMAGDPRQRFLAGYYADDDRRIPILECHHLPEV